MSAPHGVNADAATLVVGLLNFLLVFGAVFAGFFAVVIGG